MTGDLRDTYVAALQHDLVDLPAETHLLGVVRKPTPWFYGAVDDNRPSLGPTEELLDEFDAHREGLAARGMCDEGAHNAAWEELGFGARYREYLESEEPRDAMDAVLARLGDDEDVALVCYENTERKRCHRTILRDVIETERS